MFFFKIYNENNTPENNIVANIVVSIASIQMHECYQITRFHGFVDKRHIKSHFLIKKFANMYRYGVY